jgi:hypothetical protein
MIFKTQIKNDLYTIKHKYRISICNNNIIFYIAHIVQILLNEKCFYNKIDPLLFIKKATYSILGYGKHFLPNWEELTKKID